jgi:hypothetical protein
MLFLDSLQLLNSAHHTRHFQHVLSPLSKKSCDVYCYVESILKKSSQLLGNARKA